MTDATPTTTGQPAEPQPLSLSVITLLGLSTGVIAGAGAVLFRALIAVFHNLLFLGEYSLSYDANAHTQSGPWGPLIIFVPVLGALAVAFLVSNFAPEAKGHGVPEIMDAIYHRQGRIRPVVALVKSIASSLSIGSGGSVGREGPIAQIGSSFGSTLGQVISMPVSQRVVLIAAGAGAGIAATFNTPLGGLTFAIELMLPAIHAGTLLPTTVATVTASYIGRAVLGLYPAFYIPSLQLQELHLVHPVAYLPYLILAVIIGLAATLFIHVIYWFEDLFDRIPGNYYTRHVLGMVLVGLMMWLLLERTGHYYVQGVGYATIEDILRGSLSAPLLLVLLVFLKLLATSLTLGSGASGGVFSPALFVGAGLGGGFGAIVSRLLPGPTLGIPAFAIVGMAGMVAGATGAVVTATAMVFEMTRDYNVILPVILAVGLAYGIRKRISFPSIYTLKLLRRNLVVPEGLEAALHTASTASRIMTTDFTVRPAPSSSRAPETELPDSSVVVLEAAGVVAGVLYDGEDAAQRAEPEEVGYVFVDARAALHDMLAEMLARQAPVALVVSQPGSLSIEDVVGVVTQRQLASVSRNVAGLLR